MHVTLGIVGGIVLHFVLGTIHFQLVQVDSGPIGLFTSNSWRNRRTIYVDGVRDQ